MTLKSASLFFTALALALLCARFASAERIRIAYSAISGVQLPLCRRCGCAYSAISGVQLPLWTAKESGFFKRHGLDVDFLYIGGGSVVVQAMLGGEVQLSRASAPGIVQAALHGADLVMIANTVNTLVYSVMTRPDVKSPEDLRGKTLGVTRLGGGTDYVVTLLLKKWNFQRGRDVKVFQTGGMPQLLSAVQTGVVDAGVISPPR